MRVIFDDIDLKYGPKAIGLGSIPIRGSEITLIKFMGGLVMQVFSAGKRGA
jgi:hypothetical protein